MFDYEPKDPCPEHPHWDRGSCHWCDGFVGSHPSTIPDYLPKKERDLVYEQTGVRVERRSDMRRKLSERGQRVLERGEPGDRMRRDLSEWVRSGGEASGAQAPSMQDYISSRPRQNPVDIRPIWKENLERAKARYRDSD